MPTLHHPPSTTSIGSDSTRHSEHSIYDPALLYRQAMAQLEAGFCIIKMLFDEHDRAYDYLFVETNPAFSRHTGLVQATGKRIRELVPDHDAHWFERYGQVALSGVGTRFEDNAAAMKRWFEVQAYRVGQPEDRLVAVLFQDITDKKRVYDALSESELRFRRMADYLPLPVWMVDEEGGALFTNKTYQKLFGVSPEEINGKGWHDLLHPQDAEAFVSALNAAASQRIELRAEARLRRADGQWRWIESIGAPRWTPDGVYLGLAGNSIDVTERHEIEDSREQILAAERSARSAAESESQIKDEFLGTLSHELRTPLSVVLGWSRLLAKKADPHNEQLQRGLLAITRSAETQAALVSDMLDLSGILLGKITIEPESLDAAQVLQECLSGQEIVVQSRGIRILADDIAAPCWIRGDAVRLQQIINNLLSNAIKFSPDQADIDVSMASEHGQCVLTVRDRGAGIDPQFLPFLFDRFRQADASNTRKAGGLGLGLSIAKQLVNMHGGRIEAHSAGVGHGATFIVTLPIDYPVSDGLTPIRQTMPERQDIIDNDVLAGVSILAVDDQPDLLEHMKRVLEDLGARVIAVSSAGAALNLLQGESGQSFNAVVSDIGLPSMDGYQMMRSIRRDLRISPEQLHAVAVTALAREKDRDDALAAGYQDHIPKPYNIPQLVLSLRQGATAPSRR